MSEKAKKKYKIPRARIIYVYFLCVLGSTFAPLGSYFETGNVETHAIYIGLITFVIGITTVTIVISTMAKTGKFAQFELDPEE